MSLIQYVTWTLTNLGVFDLTRRSYGQDAMASETDLVAEYIIVELSRHSPWSHIYRLETFRELQSYENYLEFVIDMKKWIVQIFECPN